MQGMVSADTQLPVSPKGVFLVFQKAWCLIKRDNVHDACRRKTTTHRCACPMGSTGSLRAAGMTSMMPSWTAECCAMLLVRGPRPLY